MDRPSPRVAVYAALAALAAAFVYLNALACGFVYDDHVRPFSLILLALDALQGAGPPKR